LRVCSKNAFSFTFSFSFSSLQGIFRVFHFSSLHFRVFL